MIPHLLTIAGSDSSGGAGIQAGLKTFTSLKVYGYSVITAITAQNTPGVQASYDLPARSVGQQLDFAAKISRGGFYQSRLSQLLQPFENALFAHQQPLNQHLILLTDNRSIKRDPC